MDFRITCETEERVPWAQLKDYERNRLKGEGRDLTKLRVSVERYGFAFPLFVWRKYVLDGAGRCDFLDLLDAEGVELPPIPVVKIQAKTKRQAEERVLAVSSQYAHVTEASWRSFTEGWDKDLASLEPFSFPGVHLALEFPEPEPPVEFKEYGDTVTHTYTCPKCKYRW